MKFKLYNRPFGPHRDRHIKLFRAWAMPSRYKHIVIVIIFVMVHTTDGSIRVCVDHRAVNECTAKDAFPLPRIDVLIDKLRNAKFMTHLDLCFAHNQV